MRREHYLTALLGAMITLVALIPIGYSISKNLTPPIVTIDLQQLLEEEQQRMVSLFQNKTPSTNTQRQQAEEISIVFAKRLSSTIHTLGNECNCVILNKAALLGGNTLDYTNQVREEMMKAIQ